MRLSIVTATMSLASSVWAGIVIPLPPPGSACLSYLDTYPKPKKPSRRSLGITTLPRLWARDVLMRYREMRTDQPAESRQTIACACVPVGQKAAVGFYTKAMCPAQHGAYEACSVELDGSGQVLLKTHDCCCCNWCLVDSVSLCICLWTRSMSVLQMRSAMRHSQARRLGVVQRIQVTSRYLYSTDRELVQDLFVFYLQWLHPSLVALQFGDDAIGN